MQMIDLPLQVVGWRLRNLRITCPLQRQLGQFDIEPEIVGFHLGETNRASFCLFRLPIRIVVLPDRGEPFRPSICNT